ncbi:polysaccharide deacetylase family protein [Priestia megaterium]|uniref:polysaccharide deacetylase family protein n=1 Tax=Priestia megaterium TaxID=1404 RepID=UPI001FD35A5F|nr:polysaccharide deacetylase family protein [Priestia megaterium]
MRRIILLVGLSLFTVFMMSEKMVGAYSLMKPLFSIPLPQDRVIHSIPIEKKKIALTFDDGPTSDETVQILDILKEYNAKATFFVVGSRVERHASIVKREIREGHEVGNHTFHHLIWTGNVSEKQLIKEIELTQNTISNISGYNPSLFRPVQGFYDKKLVDVVGRSNLRVVLWSQKHDTRDWDRPGVEYIVQKVLNDIENGDIILLHDHVHGKSQTILALKRILPVLKEKGYECVTVSELLKAHENKRF